MENYSELNNKKDIIDSISVLEKELSEKTGKNIAVIAYSPTRYLALDHDTGSLAKITELEKEISQKTGKEVIRVAFSL